MRSRRATMMNILIMGSLASGSSARADAGIVVVGGNATDHDRAMVGSAIEGAAREAGWTLSTRPLSRKDSDGLLGCSDAQSPWSCVPSSLGTDGIHRVFVIAVETGPSDAGGRAMIITGKVIATDLQAVVVNRRYCEPCADDQLTKTSAMLAEQMLHELAIRVGRTKIMIRTTPSGAQVTLDGDRVGVTDGKFNTYGGTHTVILQRPGFQTETKQISVVDGQVAELSVNLQTSSGGHKPGRNHPLLIPGIVTGAGLVALIGGTYVSWTADSPRTGPQDEYLYSGPGIGFAVAGSLVIGAGVYLWVRASRRRSTPTASVTAGGALVGWVTAF